MTLNSRSYSTKFGIRFDDNTPLRPSLTGLLVLGGLHLGACVIVWQLNWPYLPCIFVNIVILWLMVAAINRYIFSTARYQLSFVFGDASGWVIQQEEYICYRAVLRYAFCGRYLVILVFQNKLILPIFFDSLPAAEFRQLRKVLILLNYV